MLRQVQLALESFTPRIIFIMEKLKLNFPNLTKDTPKTSYKANTMIKSHKKKTATNSVIIIFNKNM